MNQDIISETQAWKALSAFLVTQPACTTEHLARLTAAGVIQALDAAGFQIMSKPQVRRPHIVERTTTAGVTTIRSEELVPGGHETETEKAAREASVLIAQILQDGGRRQSEVGVEVAAKEAVAQIKRDRGRMAFEDIDKTPPYGPSMTSELISTWFRSLGDAVEWCECALRLRKIVITGSLRRWPTLDQQEDFTRRLDMIRGTRGVVGVDYTSGMDGHGRPEPIAVEIRFDHYISTVGCEFTPLDLPIRKAA